MWLHDESLSICQQFRLVLCSLSLVFLGRHKVVVNFCLRSNGNAVSMLKHFVAYLRMFYKQGFSEALETLVEIGLEGLANFAKASKAFREAIIDLDASLGIFSALKDAFSEDHRSCFSLTMIQRMRSLVSRLMVSLTLSPDSQRTCLIDRGLIQILVRIYETTPSLPEHPDPPSDLPLSLNPAFRCNLTILRLLDDGTAAEKLRLTGAFNALEPHQSIMNRAMPNIQPWGFVAETLSGLPFRFKHSSGDPYSSRDWKMSGREFDTGESTAQVVCSWKHCDAGTQSDQTVNKFKKCARCEIAHYCR